MADPLALQAHPVFEVEEIVAPGVRIFPIHGMAFASIAARHGRTWELGDRMQARFGLTPPSGPNHVEADDLSLLGSGPGTWLALSPDPALANRLSSACEGVAAVADQSGAYGVLALEGPSSRDLLARMVAIDLRDSAFPTGASAVLALGHLGGVLWRLAGEHRFRVAVSRSTAGDLWRHLSFAAASLTACG